MIQVDDLVLVSVDDHLIEPPDLFADHLEKLAQLQGRAERAAAAAAAGS